eukprot:6207806-Pleurochrysis_carterae.AAC.5
MSELTPLVVRTVKLTIIASQRATLGSADKFGDSQLRDGLHFRNTLGNVLNGPESQISRLRPGTSSNQSALYFVASCHEGMMNGKPHTISKAVYNHVHALYAYSPAGATPS